MKNLKVRLVVLGIPLLLLAWFFRPFFHDFIMSLYISPLQILFFGLLIAGIYFLVKKVGKLRFVRTGIGAFSIQPVKDISNKTTALYSVLFVFILFITILGLSFESEIRYYLAARQIDFTNRETIPEMDSIRLTPKPVAARYAQDTFQSPQETLGDSQIVLEKGKLVRVFPRIPDGALLYFINKLSGFVTVDVNTLERKVSISDQQFKYSDGIGITDNIYFQLIKKKYFVTYSSEPIYLKDDSGKWQTIVPYISYKNFPFRVPYWGGVMVVHSDGSIEDMSPEQAAKVSYMKGNRIYPKELTNYYTESYAYKNGLINKWFLHKNETEIVSLEGDETIIHASTKEGFKQIVVAEPYGRSYGIYKIFIIDATTGAREIIEYNQSSQLTGPIAAADYIRKSFPTYNWNNFTLSEPRPMNIRGDLYWLLSVIPNDSAGIATTVLLDAKTNKVTEVKTEEELKLFITGQPVEVKTESTNANTKDSNTEINTKIDQIINDLNSLKKSLELTPTPNN
ncbi:MAG: hypothetical protein WCP14_04060 [bacterium]